VSKLCRVCKEGTADVFDEERSRRPCLVMNDLKGNVNAKIRKKKNRRFTVPPPEETFSRLESEE
jgi:hypothetical protein